MRNSSLQPPPPRRLKQATKNRVLRAIRDGALAGRGFAAKTDRLVCSLDEVKHVICFRTLRWEGTETLSLGLAAGVYVDGFDAALGRPATEFPQCYDCLVNIMERPNLKGGMVWKGRLPWPEETFERVIAEMNAVCRERLLPFLDGLRSRRDVRELLLSAPADKLPLRIETEAHRWQSLAVLAKLDGDLDAMNEYLDRAGACVSSLGLEFHKAICSRLRETN